MSLLLLRVFGYKKRSERLLDELGHKWRYLGHINLIAATDLASSYLQPHELLDFVSGKLSRSFVKGEADLDRRIASLDTAPDPDGRYRVNEFFCHEDTWQITMRRLALISDAVLMDLRSFSPQNRGCLFELQQLVNTLPLSRVLFLIDDSTDRAFLDQTMREVWSHQAKGSPNFAAADTTTRLIAARSVIPNTIRSLMALLAGAKPT
jgi:hypothetical protein